MIIKTFAEAAIVDNPHHVDARNLHSSGTLSITVITLEPGQSLKRHITPVDVAFYVLAGEGVVEIGDEQLVAGPDMLIESPKGIVHCWRNESSGLLRFIVAKAPRPTEKTLILES